ELTENTHTAANRTAELFESKITALTEKCQTDTEFVVKTLSKQIESRAVELSENTKAEAAKTTTLLENKITAFAESSQAGTASLANTLSHQIDSQIRNLNENARRDVAKTTTLIGSLEEKITAFAETNRVALELQGKTLGAQLKAQLKELSEASDLQTADLKKLLDTGIGAVEQSITTISENSRAEFQSRFKAIDEQF